MNDDDVIELFAPVVAVRLRSMFGGKGVFAGDAMVALVAYGELYLKADQTTRDLFHDAGGVPFSYDGKGQSISMSYWSVPAEALETPAAFAPFAEVALAAGRRAKANARPRKPRSRGAGPRDGGVRR